MIGIGIACLAQAAHQRVPGLDHGGCARGHARLKRSQQRLEFKLRCLVGRRAEIFDLARDVGEQRAGGDDHATAEFVLTPGEGLYVGLVVPFGFEQRADDLGCALGLAARLEQGLGFRLFALERLQRIGKGRRQSLDGNPSGLGRSTLASLSGGRLLILRECGVGACQNETHSRQHGP